ncbi:sigma-70 family RNA polymerase sigma factor [Saccharopolyspora gregorii]|uniref:sigma-70 family RNA polymerase sigma factor n=1 Tax=Saccharopolyspora gregorii TaxID=33914 RepID=UPI0021ACB58B|nr:sigma-70 family RNA polymerase sigma factor [Saccharopolyspora gregorii]
MCRDPLERDADSGENGALTTAHRAFSLLTAGPRPLALNGRNFPGLPLRWVPLDEVQQVVLHRRCPQPLRDRIWAHLARRSRAEGGAWTVACVGVALPALLTITTRLTARHALDAADLHAAVLTGFLSGVAEIDLEAAGIMNRLRWAAFRAGHTALRDALDTPPPTSETSPGEETTGPGRAPVRLLTSADAGHPDLVLARAVADGVLTPAEADVIAATRLDRRSLRHIAAEGGHSYEVLKKQRQRAEGRLAAHLTAPGEHPDGPSTPPHRTSLPVTNLRAGSAPSAGKAR